MITFITNPRQGQSLTGNAYGCSEKGCRMKASSLGDKTEW